MKRADVYSELEKRIGNTRVETIKEGTNQIHIKYESENPFGSHYDRVYLELFKHFENREDKLRIQPGDTVLETSSGSAGISFGGVGKALGYDTVAVIPEQLDETRKQAVAKHVDAVELAQGDYVNAFENWLMKNKRRWVGKEREMTFLNHSMGPRDKNNLPTENYVTTQALKQIATEALQQIDSIDYFIPAIGNGSSIVGPARVFKKHSPKTQIIGYETFQSATGLELKHPGLYKTLFGIEPGTLKQHNMPGTSYKGIDFPHLRIAAQEQLDDIVLVTDENMIHEYQQRTTNPAALQRVNDLVRWDTEQYGSLGRSSQAALAVAKNLAKNTENKDFFIIAYDAKEGRYDS